MMRRMTRIYLLRHGLVDNPQHLFYGPTFVLSERGTIQIGEVAQDMVTAGVKPVAVRYSPFQRTTDSMKRFVQTIPCSDVRVDERLVEWQVGKWLDRPLVDFYAATHYDTPEWTFDPAMETHPQMARRVLEVVHEICEAYPDQDVLLISHREPIVCALLALQNLPPSQVHDVVCPVACVWEVCFDGNRFVSARKAFDRSADGHAQTMG
jgi:broad specificity phosphatase PhoE